MKRRGLRYVGATILILVLTMLTAGTLACTPDSASEPAEETPPPSGSPATIEVTAESIAFNVSTITVPAGAAVTITFTNNDAVNHSLAIYETSAAAEVIFRGRIIGRGTTDYQFTAPTTPGKYFFRCDVHPSFMTGDFIVIVAQ